MLKTFQPNGSDTVTLAASSTNAAAALDQFSHAVRVHNKGPSECFINFGLVGVVSTTAKMPVASGATETFTKGNLTHVAVICAGTDTATVRFTSGEGL